MLPDAAPDNAYELALPCHIRQILESAPVAYVPIGCLEYHGPHLPLGVDMLTADALCHRTAKQVGGLVLPPLYVATGVLPLPYGICHSTNVLRLVIRPVLDRLAAEGFRVIIVFSGHGPFDHLHVLREECDRVMSEHPDLRARATIWNELTVDLEGDIHDHGARVETSYMMELWPDTVHLDRLTDDPAAEHVGVYAANPRFTASREWGRTLSDTAVNRLEQDILAMLRGDRIDNWADLKKLVSRLQAGDMEVVEDSGCTGGEGMQIELHNPHAQSKYITAVANACLDGEPLPLENASIRNVNTGEGHTDRCISELGPLTGFYVRRKQNMQVLFPAACPPPGRYEISLNLIIADVLEVKAAGTINLRSIQ